MGCSGSKEVALTAAQNNKVKRLAEDTLNRSENFKNVSRAIVPIMPEGVGPAEILADKKPFSSYFEGGAVPPYIRDGNQSFADTYGQMQTYMQNEAKKQFMPQLLREYPSANKDAKLREQCERNLKDASSKELSEVTKKFLVDVQNGHGGALPRDLEVEDRSLGIQSQQPQSEGDNCDPTTQNQEFILPVGKWEIARGTPFYWSHEENLFFHPPSGQFYDPNTEKWYDPDQDEWYAEE